MTRLVSRGVARRFALPARRLTVGETGPPSRRDESRFIEVVRNSITDGQVSDWVLKNVKKPESVKAAHRERMLSYPKPDDAQMQARLKKRKEEAGLAHRDDVRSFVNFIDADEKRL